MKSKIFKGLLIAFVLFGLILSSCQQLPFMTAKIADKNFKALYILATYGKYNDENKGFLLIASDSSDIETSTYLAILIRGDKAGTYQLDLTNTSNLIANCEAVYIPGGLADSTNKYAAVKGSVTLNNVDFNTNRISGTFSFTLQDKNGNTIQISNGQFGNIIFLNINDKLSGLNIFDH